jgi:hypothetical protein
MEASAAADSSDMDSARRLAQRSRLLMLLSAHQLLLPPRLVLLTEQLLAAEDKARRLRHDAEFKRTAARAEVDQVEDAWIQEARELLTRWGIEIDQQPEQRSSVELEPPNSEPTSDHPTEIKTGGMTIEQARLKIYLEIAQISSDRLNELEAALDAANRRANEAARQVEKAGEISSDHHLWQTYDAALDHNRSVGREWEHEARRLVDERGVDWDVQREAITIDFGSPDEDDVQLEDAEHGAFDQDDADSGFEQTKRVVCQAVQLLGYIHGVEGEVIALDYDDMEVFLTIQDYTVEALAPSTAYTRERAPIMRNANIKYATLGAYLLPCETQNQTFIGAFARLTLPERCSAEQLAPFLGQMIRQAASTAKLLRTGHLDDLAA